MWGRGIDSPGRAELDNCVSNHLYACHLKPQAWMELEYGIQKRGYKPALICTDVRGLHETQAYAIQDGRVFKKKPVLK